jgi:hypothetical protein
VDPRHRTPRAGLHPAFEALPAYLLDTLLEEIISRMAGSEHGSSKTVAELVAIAEGIGRPVRQRTTTYARLAA